MEAFIETVAKALLVFDDSTGVPDTPFTNEDFVNKLFPSGLWDVIIQLAALVVLLVALFFIGYKPVRNAVEKRRAYVAGQIAEAQEANRVAQEAAEHKQETIEEGKAEAARLIAEAKRQAEGEAAKIILAAEQEATAKKKQADADILLAKEKSKEEIRQEIVDVAIAASGKVLGREVSKEDNERLLEDFINDVSENR
ncbi:MAG: F0F1 ATP synthase subunit B [Bacilli bacterium]|nr:F0F1 ATP synthase subunit B [Bacilli bacterium]